MLQQANSLREGRPGATVFRIETIEACVNPQLSAGEPGFEQPQNCERTLTVDTGGEESVSDKLKPESFALPKGAGESFIVCLFPDGEVAVGAPQEEAMGKGADTSSEELGTGPTQTNKSILANATLTSNDMRAD